MIVIGAGELAIDSDAALLRAALALACATGAPFRWQGFRRKRSGLEARDAEAVRTFATMSGARVDGGGVGDDTIELEPGPVSGGEHRFELAPAVPLLPVLRVALLPLAITGGEAVLKLAGSTHGSGGDTFEVTSSTFVYLLHRIGIDVRLSLDRAGFAPRGGGEVSARLGGSAPTAWTPLTLVEREPLESIRIVSAGASLPAHVQQRQAARARSGVHISGLEPTVQLLKIRARSGGSVVAVTGQFGELPVTFASVSTRGQSAESVGEQAAAAFRRFANQPATVPEMLVDALMLFLAFADGDSRITTPRLPAAAGGVASLIRAFTGRDVVIQGKVGQAALVRIEGLQRR